MENTCTLPCSEEYMLLWDQNRIGWDLGGPRVFETYHAPRTGFGASLAEEPQPSAWSSRPLGPSQWRPSEETCLSRCYSQSTAPPLCRPEHKQDNQAVRFIKKCLILKVGADCELVVCVGSLCRSKHTGICNLHLNKHPVVWILYILFLSVKILNFMFSAVLKTRFLL